MVISLSDQTTVSVVFFVMMWLVFPFIFMQIISKFNMMRYHEKLEEFNLYWYIIQALLARPWIEIKHLVYAFRLERSLVSSMKDTDSIITNMSIIVRLLFGLVLAIPLIPIVLGRECDYLIWACLAIFLAGQSSLVRDSILFLFFCHPRDVGEICRINGVELVVKKINFFSTTFVGLDKIECQMGNGGLLRKGIVQFEGSSRFEKISLIQR